MKRPWCSLVVVVVIACDSGSKAVEAAPGSAPRAVEAAPGGAPPAVEPDSERPLPLRPESPRRPADGGLDVPPTGTYEVTARVVADDCTPKYAPPQPWRGLVHGKAEQGLAVVNVPVSALPPSNDTSKRERSDFPVTQAKPHTRHLEAGGCGPITQTLEIKDASREGFTLAITSVFGPALAGCAAPTNCTSTVEQVHKLLEFSCAAECFRGAKAAPEYADDPRVLCRCPAPERDGPPPPPPMVDD